MGREHWPFFDLRITTPRVELRYPDDDIVFALVDVAAGGVHDPATMPFMIPWTDLPPDERAVSSLQFLWRSRANLAPADWSLPFAVFADGELCGVQDVLATDFARRRTVKTGSWLARRAQGRGIGTEMRRAVLHLAFAGLGAEVAETGAWHDNEASLGVTRKLGYVPNGESTEVRRDTPDRQLHYRMPRAHWEAEVRRDDIELHGVEPCLPLLGL
jgi:RimJ/RimL family protein N-acetyltransferase